MKFSTAIALWVLLPGLSGIHSLKTKCADEPCENGAACADSQSDNTYYCFCPAEFTGRNCETRIEEMNNPCDPNPCPDSQTCFRSSGTNSNAYICY
ncbi:delta-like protein D [Patiria miniata]|uniref:EGF-like domain-containing protein n=1 Tax=Patiria miniata TaxID=46514 RepID=A0A914B3V4_PATMI|nr:delta-like protein D [Patiria miniata]